jgi:hypothetical protein
MVTRVTLTKEAALASIAGIEKFAVQAARRIVRLQERRRKLRRELKAIDDELRLAKAQLRTVTTIARDEDELAPGAVVTTAGGSRDDGRGQS